MKKTQQLYEGKAKKVYATDVEGIYIVDYKDDATAFNGEKKGTIAGKGVINNRVTNYLMKMLEEKGIPTHFVEQLSDRETAVKAVRIVPLEVIVRNVAAGSLAKRIGFPEGTKLKSTVLELCYKDDALGDPMINDSHVFAMGLCTPEELETIKKYALKINEILTAFFAEVNIAPDGGFACVQRLAQLLHGGGALPRQQIQNQAESFFCQHREHSPLFDLYD